ncbi:AhpC/TSA family protein [Clavibacter sp. VKM Ac-2873]|uniref:peroxiredoxin-like family protein n=1 Tax=Clavibacter sp. VKM Ac-2873 TaxID=2783813 RepID=UPI00188AE456|nr:peroxiredoxin-like family protein [Clavibacter sp. VKM Ac-2873]MBF4617099.1 AhpC/TSA family protein [Clavibacter sp. VKM Ac-2873]
MTDTTIQAQIARFDRGFAEQIGPDLSAVFAAEQEALRAGGVPDDAVAAGDVLPPASLVDPDGVPVDLHAALGSGPAVVVLYRGAWCPYCNLTLRHYQAELLPGLRERGATLVAVSPQTPEGSAQAVAGGGLDFAVLSDPSNAFVRALGLVTEPSPAARVAHAQLGFDVADSNADGTGDIPFPTVLVVGADRRVAFADVHVDYTTRTEVPEILAAVDALIAR